MNSPKCHYVAFTVFLCLGLTCARPLKGNDTMDNVSTGVVKKGLEQNLPSGYGYGYGSGSNGGSGTGTGISCGEQNGLPCIEPRPMPQPCPTNGPCEPRPQPQPQPCPIGGPCRGVIPGIQVPGIQIPSIQIPMPNIPVIEPVPPVPRPCPPKCSRQPKCCKQCAEKENVNKTITETKSNDIPKNGASIGSNEPDPGVERGA